MSEIKEWSTTAASNNASPPDGWPEGMAPSDVNNSARENMASIRKYYDDPEWRDWGHTITYGSATTFTTAAGDGDTTAIYHANRRVKADGTLTGTIYGTIQSSSHSTTTTVTVTWDSGSLNNESLTIWVGMAADQDHVPYAAIADITPEIPSGTKMVFVESSAPTGWTQDTSNYNGYSMRVVTGSGTGTGGTHDLSSPPSSAHTHGIGSHVHSLNNHTHTGPSHNHQWYDYAATAQDSRTWNSGGSAIDFSFASSAVDGINGDAGTSNKITTDGYTSNAGTGNTGAASGNTGAGSGNTDSDGPTAFAPLYVNVITATRD